MRSDDYYVDKTGFVKKLEVGGATVIKP
ncbi:hypothetical protein [Calditerrivibrio sp.]